MARALPNPSLWVMKKGAIMLNNFDVIANSFTMRMRQQEVLANNIANVNTVGFKKERVFQEALSTAAGKEQTEIVEATNYAQGAIRETANPFDLALEGEGFFVVQTEAGPAYTRNGHFHINEDSQLSFDGDLPVLGENGPVYIKGDFVVNEQGEVVQNGAVVDKLQIVTFDRPYPLVKAGNSLYLAPEETNPSEMDAAFQVRQGFLEDSNVNPIEEMVNMMTLYRYMEADEKVMRAQDDRLNKAVNEIGNVL